MNVTRKICLILYELNLDCFFFLFEKIIEKKIEKIGQDKSAATDFERTILSFTSQIFLYTFVLENKKPLISFLPNTGLCDIMFH